MPDELEGRALEPGSPTSRVIAVTGRPLMLTHQLDSAQKCVDTGRRKLCSYGPFFPFAPVTRFLMAEVSIGEWRPGRRGDIDSRRSGTSSHITRRLLQCQRQSPKPRSPASESQARVLYRAGQPRTRIPCHESAWHPQCQWAAADSEPSFKSGRRVNSDYHDWLKTPKN